MWVIQVPLYTVGSRRDGQKSRVALGLSPSGRIAVVLTWKVGSQSCSSHPGGSFWSTSIIPSSRASQRPCFRGVPSPEAMPSLRVRYRLAGRGIVPEFFWQLILRKQISFLWRNWMPEGWCQLPDPSARACAPDWSIPSHFHWPQAWRGSRALPCMCTLHVMLLLSCFSRVWLCATP